MTARYCRTAAFILYIPQLCLYSTIVFSLLFFHKFFFLPFIEFSIDSSKNFWFLRIVQPSQKHLRDLFHPANIVYFYLLQHTCSILSSCFTFSFQVLLVLTFSQDFSIQLVVTFVLSFYLIFCYFQFLVTFVSSSFLFSANIFLLVVSEHRPCLHHDYYFFSVDSLSLSTLFKSKPSTA